MGAAAAEAAAAAAATAVAVTDPPQQVPQLLSGDGADPTNAEVTNEADDGPARAARAEANFLRIHRRFGMESAAHCIEKQRRQPHWNKYSDKLRR